MLAIVSHPGGVEFTEGLLPSQAAELIATALLAGGATTETSIEAAFIDGTVEPAAPGQGDEADEVICALLAEMRPNRTGFRNPAIKGLHMRMRVATFTLVPDASAVMRAAELRRGGPRREALGAALESIGRPALAQWARTGS